MLCSFHFLWTLKYSYCTILSLSFLSPSRYIPSLFSSSCHALHTYKHTSLFYWIASKRKGRRRKKKMESTGRSLVGKKCFKSRVRDCLMLIQDAEVGKKLTTESSLFFYILASLISCLSILLLPCPVPCIILYLLSSLPCTSGWSSSTASSTAPSSSPSSAWVRKRCEVKERWRR